MVPLRRLVRDPLVHFLLIGAALFGADHLLHPRQKEVPVSAGAASAPAPIVLRAETRRMLADEYGRSYGRPPTDKEMQEVIDRWLDEEVLYREGLARGLERDDPRIRHLIAQKMSFVLEQAIVLPAQFEESELQAWFDAHSDNWAKPALIDFTQVFVNGLDTKAEEQARTFLTQLEKGADPNGMGDVFSGGRRYRRRNVADLAESFGGDFTKDLAGQKEGSWALRRSRFGFHLVRIDRRSAAERPTLADVRAEVEEDLRRTRRAEKLAAEVATLRKRWPVEAAP
jgi:hypothetical protein